LTLRIPDSLRVDLEQIAASEASYISAVVRRACAFEVERIQRARAQRDRRDRDARVA
jgi:hypothetical protein